MIDIYKLMNKVPAGTLLIPMAITAFINTINPSILTIPGGMTTALVKGGSLTLSALIAFAAGTGISFNSLGKIIKKSWPLIIMKLISGVGISFIFMHFFGIAGLLGINAISFVTCMCSTNPSIYLSCIQEYGEDTDMLNFVLCICLAQAAIPIFVLSSTNGSTFDIMPIISAVLPFIFGMILGNLDSNLGKTFKPTTTIALPFLGFCFGSGINLFSALKAGLAGVILAFAFLIIQIPLMLFADKILGRNSGYNGVAMCSVAGTALTIPVLLTGKIYEPYISDALAQIALCLLITCIITPFICKIVVNKWGAPKVPCQKQ